MKLQSCFRRARHLGLFSLIILSIHAAQAGSATWSSSPVSGDWNTAENWMPNTVPNGPADTATFGVSNTTEISLSSAIEVGSITFAPGASPYTIRTKKRALTISGIGITNNSGVTETFAITGDVSFRNSASAGTFVELDVSDVSNVSFHDTSSAGDGIFFLSAGRQSSPSLFFYDNSTAANGAFTLTPSFSGNALCEFFGHSSAGNGVFIAGGGRTFSCGVLFFENSTADHATITAGAGMHGGNGGGVFFGDDSSGGSARVILFGHGGITGQSEGNLTTQHDLPGLTIGSLEGNGLVDFTDPLPINLVIGSNNLSSIFSGVISDFFGRRKDSLTKIGTGTLTLSGSNSYAGRTTILQGTILVANRFGSGVGLGSVAVDGGELGGTGSILGSTTIGGDTGTASFLSPGTDGTGTCTFGQALTFLSSGVYNCELNSDTATADNVVVPLVTIDSGALVSLVDLGTATLPTGTVFTVIDNTGGTPIAGQFSNLADGAIVTVGGNNFQASYEGGDGNDLTLTVVP